MRLLVVGAGFSGATVARLLADAGHSVLVVDRREHVAGNAFDFRHTIGIRVHKYGPHIFHTNNERAFRWISRFSPFLNYRHKVVAKIHTGQFVPFPPNNTTLKAVPEADIFNTFYRPYSTKMWGVPPEGLSGDVLDRVRKNSDPEGYYFPKDRFQGFPEHGYTRLIENMLDDSNISLSLSTDISEVTLDDFDHVFNSMSIDEFFDYRYGILPYRSLRFLTRVEPIFEFSNHPVVNFTDDGPYTRSTEWKNFPGHGANPRSTVLTLEEPCDFKENNLERYYPVPDADGVNRRLYQRYLEAVPAHITFIGRCGNYAYLDMDQAISSAMSVARKFLERYQ